MKRINATALIDEARKIVSLTTLASASTIAIILLDRAGGPLAAVLGSVSVALAGRLLYIAANKQDFSNKNIQQNGNDQNRSQKTFPSN